MLVSAPERSYGRATILTGNQHIIAFSRWPVFLRHIVIDQCRRRNLRLYTGSSIPGMHWNGTSRRRLVDTVVVSRAPVTSFRTTGAIAASTTGARPLGTVTTSSTQVGRRIYRGGWGDALRLRAFRTGLTIPLSWSSHIPCLEIEPTGVANHGSSRGSTP